jgi:hypothetical protein
MGAVYPRIVDGPASPDVGGEPVGEDRQLK